MNSILLGMIAGVALALLNFLASGFYSSRVTSRSQMTSVVPVIIGFVVRLTMVGIVFYILTRVKWIHFQTSLITFAIFFTLCTLWKAARIYKEAKPLIKQQTEI
jgi:hypothetical protein